MLRSLLTLLTLAVVSQGQYFAEMDAGRRSGQFDEDGRPERHADKLNGGSSVWDYLKAYQADNMNTDVMGNFMEQAQQFYGLMTQDPELMRKNRKAHRKNGAFRSGQGEPAQARQRQMKLEEREKLLTMMENKVRPTDIPTANKLFDLWKEQQGDRPGVRQDDK